MKKQTKSALIGTGLFTLYGLFYIIFPHLVKKFHLSFGLGDKGILALGIGFIVFGIIWGLFVRFSKQYKKFSNRLKKRKKLFLFVIGGWWFIKISGIVLLITLPIATGFQVAQSMGMF